MDIHVASPYHPAFRTRSLFLALNLSGSICALATPFLVANDALDLNAFGRLIEYQLRAGTRGLVVAGSTGEGAALDTDEFSRLLEFAVTKVARRVPVFAGTGMQSTRKTIAQTRIAASMGADAALVVTPAYVRPTQDGLYRHYCEVAEHGGLPTMLYNVPTRSACDLLPETVARLLAQAGIIGIKEAQPGPERMRDLLTLQSSSFRIFSGDDPTCARAILAGAAGVISVAANIAPAAMQALCVAAATGAADMAIEADQALHALYHLLGVESNPIPVKWCLHSLGLCEEHLRLPLMPLAAAYHAQGKRVLAELGLTVSAPFTG